MNSPVGQQPNHTPLEARVVRLEGTADQLVFRVTRLEEKVEQLVTRVDRLEVTVEHLAAEFHAFRTEMREEMRSFRAEMRREFQKVYAAMFTLTVGLAGVMAHGFGWI